MLINFLMMSDELSSTDELRALAVQLGTRDWRVAQEIESALAMAGPLGIDAALWGLSHPNVHVRLRSIGGLCYQPRDPRTVAALEKILHTETDPRLHSTAHHALKHQNPDYRAMVDAQARERGIAAARARAEKADTR